MGGIGGALPADLAVPTKTPSQSCASSTNGVPTSVRLPTRVCTMRGSRFSSAMMQPRCARAPHPTPRMRSCHPPRSPVDTVVSFDASCGRPAVPTAAMRDPTPWQPFRQVLRSRGFNVQRHTEARGRGGAGVVPFALDGYIDWLFRFHTSHGRDGTDVIETFVLGRRNHRAPGDLPIERLFRQRHVPPSRRRLSRQA